MHVFSIVTAIIGTGAISCSAITDFDNPPDTKINIGEELGPELTVTLSGDTAVVNLGFVSDLPVDSADEVYAMIGDEIGLRITNEESFVSVALTDTPVDREPSAPGEYQVTIDDNMLDVTIVFYNEAVDGQMLRVGGNYIAGMQVLENKWFETGDFDFDVVVE